LVLDQRKSTTLFLDEVGALAKVKELFGRAKQAKIAVAFWGRDAVETLGIDRPSLEVDIVCNLDSGACNPFEIEKLQKLRPDRPVWSDPRLHGKLYWTPHGIVVGSSNASTNGLAVEEGLAGWAEANVFSDASNLIKATLEWFNARKNASYEITDTHLRLAEAIWKKRAQSASPGIQLTGDLGAAVRSASANPVWSKIKLAIYSEDLSKEAKKQIKDDRATNPALKDYDVYESWHDAIEADDWLLDFRLGDTKAAFGGYWRVPNPKLETELLTYVQEADFVMLQGFGKLALSAADRNKLEEAARSIARTKVGAGVLSAMVSIREAIEFVDRPKVASDQPDLRAFERVMRDIFTQATKIGYKPTEFLHMIDRDGPLPTAKRLILSSAPSSGFTRLWELKRLDLTVEALALRKPWRRLFTADELERARQRLKKFEYNAGA
jgi:hypothetical protein